MNVADKLFPHVWRFNNQYFFSSLVGVYAIELPEFLLFFEIPSYDKKTHVFAQQFNKPIKALLSHGSTGIADGSKWQSELEVEVYLQEEDKNYSWLKMEPNILFGKELDLDTKVEVIYTPGHSAGSVCLLYKPDKILFTGDTLCGNKDGIITEGSHNDDPGMWRKSCRKLLGYDFDHILPFHYEMIMNDGKKALENLVTNF